MLKTNDIIFKEMLLHSLSQSLKFTNVYINKPLILIMMNKTTTRFIFKYIYLDNKFDRNVEKNHIHSFRCSFIYCARK